MAFAGKTDWAASVPSGQRSFLNSQYWMPGAVGNVYYVSSVLGSSAGPGWTPEMAYATLEQAIDVCVAGDTIVLLPGHVETYTTTGVKAVFDADGIQIIGMGQGASRPTFTFSHTGATWTWSGAGITLRNVLLVTGVDSVVTYCTISGADATLEDVETRDTTDVEVITDFTITGARPTIRRLLKNGYTSGDANVRVLSMNGVARALIEDCVFITKVTTAIIGFVTTACTGIVIRRCQFDVASTTNYSKNVVDTIGGSTWLLAGGNADLGAGHAFDGGSGAAVAAVTGTGLTATGAGTPFVVQTTVTSSAIPNNTQTAGAITGAASGAIVIDDIILETDGTGIAGPTNLEITTDNVKGLTGAAAPNVLQAVSALGANKTVVCKTSSTTKVLPLTLESGKKLYIDGDDGAGTGAGTVRITLLCRRVADAGSLAAGGIGS